MAQDFTVLALQLSVEAYADLSSLIEGQLTRDHAAHLGQVVFFVVDSGASTHSTLCVGQHGRRVNRLADRQLRDLRFDDHRPVVQPGLIDSQPGNRWVS